MGMLNHGSLTEGAIIPIAAQCQHLTTKDNGMIYSKTESKMSKTVNIANQSINIHKTIHI